MIMPVTVRRRAKAQPVTTATKLSKVGQVMTQDSGCSRSRNDGTRDTGASLLNALASQPRIVREAPPVPERLFLVPRSAKVELSRRAVFPRSRRRGGRRGAALAG